MALVHIYCGDGKGKTSAAVGMAVRAAGRGLKVVMVRFLKSDDSGAGGGTDRQIAVGADPRSR